jgi:hypothetical protein
MEVCETSSADVSMATPFGGILNTITRAMTPMCARKRRLDKPERKPVVELELAGSGRGPSSKPAGGGQGGKKSAGGGLSGKKPAGGGLSGKKPAGGGLSGKKPAGGG